MSITRREMCLLLPAALFPAVMRPEGMAAQEGSMPSAMYPFEKLPIRTPNKAEIRDVLKGKLATGESLEVHEQRCSGRSTPPGNHHVHSEMWLIREGTVELTVDGTSYRLGPAPSDSCIRMTNMESRMWHNACDILCGGCRSGAAPEGQKMPNRIPLSKLKKAPTLACSRSKLIWKLSPALRRASVLRPSRNSAQCRDPCDPEDRGVSQRRGADGFEVERHLSG